MDEDEFWAVVDSWRVKVDAWPAWKRAACENPRTKRERIAREREVAHAYKG